MRRSGGCLLIYRFESYSFFLNYHFTELTIFFKTSLHKLTQNWIIIGLDFLKFWNRATRLIEKGLMIDWIFRKWVVPENLDFDHYSDRLACQIDVVLYNEWVMESVSQRRIYHPSSSEQDFKRWKTKASNLKFPDFRFFCRHERPTNDNPNHRSAILSRLCHGNMDTKVSWLQKESNHLLKGCLTN